MAAKSGAEIFEQYRARMSQSMARIQKGAETTEKSQVGNAIKQKELMKQRIMEAIDNGSWETGLRNAGDQKWLRNLVQKGIPKITAGIDANKPEIIAKMEKVGQVGEMVSKEVDAMPKGGVEESIARVRRSMEIQKDQWGK